MATLQLETLLSDEKLLFQKDHHHVEQLLLLLRLEGKCSLLSLSPILKALEGFDHRIGHFRPLRMAIRVLECHIYLRLGYFGLENRLLGWPTP